MTHELCNAPQPDDPGRRCIRYLNHEGPHQTFVAEWNEGDEESRRRPKPPAAPQRNKPKQRPFKRR